MEVVCTNCRDIHEIHEIKEAICEKCKRLMSPYEIDVLKVLAAQNREKDDVGNRNIGL